MGNDYVKPEGTIETELAAIWSKLLGVTEVGALDDFFELGGNSLVAVRFFARLKKDFAVSLPLSTLFQAPTIRTLAAAMRDHGYQASGTAAPLPPIATKPAGDGLSMHSSIATPLLIRPGTGKPPLFLMHDGLGEVMLYRSLAIRLGPEHAVYGLEPETSGGRFIHTRIVDMARAKVERIRSVQPSGPYLLAGLCAGGVIAFEVARQLQDAGERTLFVGIIDGADVAAEEVKLRIARGRLERLVATLRPAENQSIGSFLSGVVPTLINKVFNAVKYEVSTRMEQASTAKTVAALRREAPAQSGAAQELDFLKLYEQAHKEHIAQGTFSGGDVVLFRATQGDGSVGDLPFRDVYVDPLMGWQQRVH